MNVVICGAGVIGTSIAYFLSLKGIQATVIEREAVACAASGNSGGFIAEDWCDGQPQEQLARRSFALHAELAARFGEAGIDYGYRRMQTLSLASSEQRHLPSRATQPAPQWLSSDCAFGGVIGDERTTAQIHPKRFTQAMMNAAIENGASLRQGTVDALLMSNDSSQVRGVRVDGESLQADAVVIAMGPWSDLFRDTLGLPPIAGLKGNSILLRPTEPVPAHALFVEYECADGTRPSPEIIPRADGDVWLCGMPGNDALPADPTAITVDLEACAELQRIAARLCRPLSNAKLIATQACYRPICADAMPLIGPVPAAEGAFIASAHNCWGMLNAPATALVMSELLADGVASSIDITPLRATRKGLA
ncbi:MAG: glycine/D-amino acid oxidase-like deaminating enzyme [Gammaproteobacteria bacterium]